MASVDYPHHVTARFYEYIEPIDRGSRYEDPLDAALKEANVGMVDGGGTQLNPTGGIAFAEIEIYLANLDGALDLVAQTLERAGAPQRSEIWRDGKVLREFGTQQCLAVFLDGVSLPDDVYANLDFDAVIKEIGAAAGRDSFRTYWQGPEETGLFYFGPNADEMFARVEPVLRKMPIGQNARIVIRYGKDALNPRTVRLPRAAQ